MLKISDNTEIEQSNLAHSIINDLVNKSLSNLGRLMVKLGLVI